jgi:radical SAM/Cys-rich protein
MDNLFDERIAEITGSGLFSDDIEVIQLNLGLRCNQICAHCHVDASPERSEMMTWTTMERACEIIDEVQPAYVDLTGGAPELNLHFKRLVSRLSQKGHAVQLRTNLTVLLEPETAGLPEFLREHVVQLVASLPCYLEENVRSQRGSGTYEKSMEALRRLNALGYGTEAAPPLNLVYNPGGAFLPPDQAKLEPDYRRELHERFGIRFTRLLTITNMPLGRFWEELRRSREDRKYMALLREAFNPNTLKGLMCRHQISIGWDGRVYDCDFNLALGIPVDHGAPNHIRQFAGEAVARRRIVTGNHCFGCTAGFGSSCRGALV